MTKTHCDVCDKILDVSTKVCVVMIVEVFGDTLTSSPSLTRLRSKKQWDLCPTCADRVDSVLYPPPEAQ